MRETRSNPHNQQTAFRPANAHATGAALAVRVAGALLVVCLAAISAAACSLTITEGPSSTPADSGAPTPTRAPASGPPVRTNAIAAPAATLPALVNDPGPYTVHTDVLDSVCFEFLASIAGESWAWSGPDDVAAFATRIHDSDLCPRPADFDVAAIGGALEAGDTVWVGTVQAAVGCDAALVVTGLHQDDARHALTVLLDLRTRPSCPYDLLQPLVVALPRPPADYQIDVAVRRVEAPP